MKRKVISATIAVAISLGLLFFLWPKDNAPTDKDAATSTKKKANSSRLKLMVKTKDSLKEKLPEKGDPKTSKSGSQSSETDDSKEKLGQQLRDAVKNGTMSKKKAIQIWRDKTGGRHPWEGQMKKWGKGKGKGGARLNNWLRENAVYMESRTLTVKGRLVDMNNQAIADAQLSVLPMAALAKPPRMGVAVEGVSDQEGRFKLTAEGHQFRLFIQSPDGIESKNILIPLSESNDVDLGDIQLGRAYRVQGVVKSPEGDGVSGATVRVYTPADYTRLIAAENVAYVSPNIRAIAESQSNATGDYEFQLARGSYIFVASKQGSLPSKAQSINLTDRPLNNQNLSLRAPRTLSILVKDQNDRGLADVTIKLTQFGVLYRNGNPVIAEIITDAEGRARVDQLLFRRYQIVADAEGYARVLREFQFSEDQSTQDIALTIFTGAQVSGKILAKDSGNPVMATLVCSGARPDGQPDMQRLLAKTPVNEDGTFSYPRVAPGNYILAVHSRGYARIDVPFTVTPHHSLVDLGTIEMNRVGEVAITVILGAGELANSGTVQIHQGNSNAFLTATIEADREGSVTFENVALTNSVVTVLDKAGKILGFQDLDLSSESTATVRLIPANASLTGLLQSSQGTGQSGTLYLLRVGGPVPFIAISANETGVINHSNLPPGAYDVYLPPSSTVAQPGFSRPSLGALLGRINLEANKTTTKNFQLPAPTPSSNGE